MNPYARIQPTGKQSGQPENQDPDGLPHKLEEKQWQHLDWVTCPVGYTGQGACPFVGGVTPASHLTLLHDARRRHPKILAAFQASLNQ